LQSNVNNQIATVSDAKVDKTDYNSKMNQIDTSLTSLDGKITSEAEARVLADNALSGRVKTLEDADYQTKADVQLLIANAGVTGGGEVNVDLTNYYTKSEVDSLVDNVEVDLTGYATTSYVNTEVAKKSDVGHQHTNYATSTHTHSNYLTAVPDEYITETELANKHYATEQYVAETLDMIDDNTMDVSFAFSYYNTQIPSLWYTSIDKAEQGYGDYGNYLWTKFSTGSTSRYHVSPWSIYSTGSGSSTGSSVDLSNYYTKSQVDAKIPNLSGYAKTEDIPDVSGYLTEEQVIALINQYGGSGGANLPSSEEVEF
jgi:hypothetical protein